MSDANHGIRAADLRDVASLIRRGLKAQGEVRPDTGELAPFLGNGRPLDNVSVQGVIRDLAAALQWRSFVFDYGARVRFSSAVETRRCL